LILAEPLQITQRIAQEFERLHIRYFVGGSLASSLHGIPRATHDVDMVAEISYDHIPDLIQSLESEFYIDMESIREAIQERNSFNIIHLPTMFKIDIFILKPDFASQQEMLRRGRYQITDNPEQTLFIASAEDIVIQKLYWFQLGGKVSERQWNDVLGVLRVQREKLDYAYLERTTQEMGVRDLLDQALKDMEQKGAIK